ncbi:MAG: universal stress protein [Candidatus Methanoplasma sp.]|jgi:nucleotide-binding universal stress UspA family protein|nr:universal stress protein [Candidatus Methanoplasma sp.]
MYKKILISTDGTESNRHAVDDGIRLAKALGAEVTALFVFDIGNYSNVGTGIGIPVDREYVINTSEEALAYAKEQGEKAGVKVTLKMVSGHPAEAIVEESASHDLVVCGTLGRAGLSRALLGSVAEKVVRFSYAPVLVCRKPK